MLKINYTPTVNVIVGTYFVRIIMIKRAWNDKNEKQV